MYMLQNVTCKPGYVCELQKVQCKKEPCYPQPTCVLAPGALCHISIVSFAFVTIFVTFLNI